MFRPWRTGKISFCVLLRVPRYFHPLSTGLAAILLGGLLFRSIASPVEALAGASRTIAAGDLSVRVNIHRSDELGELIRQFNAMAESIEASEEWKRQIISDAAHELRTPIAIIQGELEMILEGVYTADRSRIEGLFREAELMARLIRELGELSAVEGGRVQLEKGPCDLSELATKTAASFVSRAERQGVSIHVEKAESAEVYCDGQKIQQVLLNLLSNALKVMPEGGKLDLYIRDTGKEQILSVDDSGPGIPEELREKVFQRFFRMDPSRSRESGGAGLGLAISRQIMQLHGGRIWADRGMNGGRPF